MKRTDPCDPAGVPFFERGKPGKHTSVIEAYAKSEAKALADGEKERARLEVLQVDALCVCGGTGRDAAVVQRAILEQAYTAEYGEDARNVTPAYERNHQAKSARSTSCLNRRAQSGGRAHANRARPPLDGDMILDLYDAGWSLRRICRKYGLHRNQVRRILNKGVL